MRQYTALFDKDDINDVLNRLRIGLQQKIDSEKEEYLSAINDEEYLQHVISKHTVDAPVLRLKEMTIAKKGDVSIDVSGRFDYAVDKSEGPVFAKGTYVTVAIPFDGDGQLFQFKLPSTHYSVFRGVVVGQEIHITYDKLPQDQKQLKSEIENDKNRLEKLVQELKNCIEQHNRALDQMAREALQKRKIKLSGDRQLLDSLGIPLKQRDSNTAYAVPLVRKPIIVERPEPTRKNAPENPHMLGQDYINILKIIKNLSLVIERSPKSFSTLQEPDIRNIILILLNAFYEGTATGETFNGAGKTDILLRWENQNLFIAECKFWKGEKAFIEALGQLSGYITWRDTKTAIIVFNQNKNSSEVVKKIQALISTHKSFREHLPIQEAGTLSFKMVHPADSEKEFILTVMVFDTPN